jgi:hypothetical protein
VQSGKTSWERGCLFCLPHFSLSLFQLREGEVVSGMKMHVGLVLYLPRRIKVRGWSQAKSVRPFLKQ